MCHLQREELFHSHQSRYWRIPPQIFLASPQTSDLQGNGKYMSTVWWGCCCATFFLFNLRLFWASPQPPDYDFSLILKVSSWRIPASGTPISLGQKLPDFIWSLWVTRRCLHHILGCFFFPDHLPSSLPSPMSCYQPQFVIHALLPFLIPVRAQRLHFPHALYLTHYHIIWPPFAMRMTRQNFLQNLLVPP